MQIHTTPEWLRYYAFWYLILLLLFAAGAMFLDARPPIIVLFGSSSTTLWALLSLCWVGCGIAAGYLSFEWYQRNWTIFGTRDMKDMAAFAFLLGAGYNLGIVGLFQINIFLLLFRGEPLHIATGILCLGVAYYLYVRWKQNNREVFIENTHTAADVVTQAPASDDEAASDTTN